MNMSGAKFDIASAQRSTTIAMYNLLGSFDAHRLTLSFFPGTRITESFVDCPSG